MRKLILLVLLSIFSFGDKLVLQDGEIMAHTEIFGDSQINPKTKNIDSNLTINQDFESIKGKMTVRSLSLKSENIDRDKHMYEVLNIKINPRINFEINTIKKTNTGYKITGFLTLNAIKKEISSNATITEKNKVLKILGDFSIKLSEFNIKAPSLFFLTVREQIDIKYTLAYKKEK